MAESGILDSSLVLILIGVIGMLLLSVAVVFFVVVYQKRLFAQQNKIKSIETNHQKDLLESSIQAQEVERKRVAKELHDGVNSLLSAARLFIQQLPYKKSEADFTEALSEAKGIIDTAIEQTRAISHNLMPTTLDRFGVLQALEDHCKRIRTGSEIQIELSYPDDLSFNKEQDLAIYRIIQELINNTLKHAEANRIAIQFKPLEQDMTLHYSDDGKGLDPSQKGDGLGMKSIESRVNLIKGKKIPSANVQAGFHWSVQFPISAVN